MHVIDNEIKIINRIGDHSGRAYTIYLHDSKLCVSDHIFNKCKGCAGKLLRMDHTRSDGRTENIGWVCPFSYSFTEELPKNLEDIIHHEINVCNSN